MENTTSDLPPSTTYIYVRVSISKQEYGSQELKIKEFIATKGYQNCTWFREMKSGKIKCKNRSIGKILTLAKSGDTLILFDVSRAGRVKEDVIETLQQFIEKGVRVFSAMGNIEFIDTPDSQYLLSTLASYAEHERYIISERTKAGMAKARAQGKQIGRPHDSRLNSHRDEIIQMMREGKTQKQMGQVLGCCQEMVSYYIRTYNLREALKSQPSSMV